MQAATNGQNRALPRLDENGKFEPGRPVFREIFPGKRFTSQEMYPILREGLGDFLGNLHFREIGGNQSMNYFTWHFPENSPSRIREISEPGRPISREIIHFPGSFEGNFQGNCPGNGFPVW